MAALAQQERHGRFRPGVMVAEVLSVMNRGIQGFGFKKTSLRNLFLFSFCSLSFFPPSISEPLAFFPPLSRLRMSRGMLRLI